MNINNIQGSIVDHGSNVAGTVINLGSQSTSNSNNTINSYDTSTSMVEIENLQQTVQDIANNLEDIKNKLSKGEKPKITDIMKKFLENFASDALKEILIRKIF